MATATSKRRRGLTGTAGNKTPCIAGSTANLTLSAEQTVDGIALVADDRVLCKDQTDGIENGIYVVATGAWQRAVDWDGAGDVVEGTMVRVNRGTTNSDTYWRISTTGTITIDTTSVTLVQGLTDISISATATTTDESTDTTCFPTFVTAATGDLAQKTDAFLTYNSNVGVLGASTFEPTGDTAAADNAAVGYTAAEGLILTGQGSTNDVTIKNDADATVLEVATGGVNVEITAGNHIIGTAAKGIDFSVNTNAAGMTSQLFDWYEEGTWTPAVGGTATYSVNDGFYTKIGNMVSFVATMTINAIGTGSTTVISGLPFVAAAGVSYTCIVNIVSASATAIVSSEGVVAASGTTITLTSRTAASAGTGSSPIFANSTVCKVSGHYPTNV